MEKILARDLCEAEKNNSAAGGGDLRLGYEILSLMENYERSTDELLYLDEAITQPMLREMQDQLSFDPDSFTIDPATGIASATMSDDKVMEIQRFTGFDSLQAGDPRIIGEMWAQLRTMQRPTGLSLEELQALPARDFLMLKEVRRMMMGSLPLGEGS